MFLSRLSAALSRPFQHVMHKDPWQFLVLYVPAAFFLATRFRNWEMSIIALLAVLAVLIFAIRNLHHRFFIYGALWLVMYYLLVGFDPLFASEANWETNIKSVYTEVIAVKGSHRYEHTTKFLHDARVPHTVEFNGPLDPVPWENECKDFSKSKNAARYAEFIRKRLLVLEKTYNDKDWLFILEDDAEAAHSLSTFRRRFNYAITHKKDFDIIWLDVRSVVSGGLTRFPYGGITGILLRRTSIPAIVKTLEFRPEYCSMLPGVDDIWSKMCLDGVLKCDVTPIVRENGKKTSLFVGLRPLDSFSKP